MKPVGHTCKSLSVSAPFKVLVLDMYAVKNTYNSDFVARTTKDYADMNVQFIHASPSSRKACWYSFYEECCTLVKCLNIDYVLTVCDRTAAVSSALRATFSHLQGPTFEGVYMAIDKSLTRDHIIPSAYNVPYQSLPVSSLRDGVPTESLIGRVGVPAIAKPANGTNSAFISVLTSREEFGRLANEETIASIEGIMSPVAKLVETFLDGETYKCALSPKLLIEQYVDRHGSDTSINSLDGLVAGGKLIPWGSTDNIYWRKHPDTFLGCGGPSSLPAATLENAWRCFEEIVTKFKPYGFDNEFINLEFFAFPDGSIKVMEINGRMFSMAKYLYYNTTNHGNPFLALVNLALGREVKQPKWLPNTYSLIAYLVTFGSGKATEHLDFEAVADFKATHAIELRVTEDTVIKKTGDAGQALAFINLTGTSFEDCTSQMDEMKYKLCKQPEYCPWFSYVNNVPARLYGGKIMK